MFYELLLPLFSVDTDSRETTKPGYTQDEIISVSPVRTCSLDDDIKSLEEKFGPLDRSRQINLTLQEILKICPRSRKRTDSYRKLVSELDKRFGIKLIITSRKGRKYA